MRHFDAWLLRDPYSIFHYYSTGRRWQETVRDLIQERKICAPPVDVAAAKNTVPVDPFRREMSSQPDSMLLQKLPPEVRLLIYEYVFGDEAVHLVQVKNKVRHVRCKHASSSIHSNRQCCPLTPARWRVNDGRMAGHSDRMLYPHTHTMLPENLSNSGVSLLRTCRAIYAEAADILYSQVEFDVDDLHTFIAFTLSVCPDRLRCIKRLTVQWTPIWQPMSGEEHKSSVYSHTHNDRLWAAFWARVMALPNLEELKLSLDIGRFCSTPVGGVIIGGKRIRLAANEPWVSPMLLVRGLRSFDLCITAKCDASAKILMEEDIKRDAVQLQDDLRSVMCSPPGQIPPISGLAFEKPCAMEEFEREDQPMYKRPRLAITAA